MCTKARNQEFNQIKIKGKKRDLAAYACACACALPAPPVCCPACLWKSQGKIVAPILQRLLLLLLTAAACSSCGCYS